jgi:glycosyltransferase involved in cell wall biosynthesis
LVATTLLTIHSGKFPQALANAKPSVRTRFIKFCNSTAAVIGVSETIADSIRALPGIDRNRVHVIPAYLAPAVVAHDQSTSGTCPGLVAITSGFGTRLYGWETLLEALSLPVILKWHMVFYSVIDEDYVESVIAEADRVASGKVTIHRNLAPEAFQALLNSCDILVRPSLTDGDSLVVREALALGLTVLASDAVTRPAGCITFTTEDAFSLSAILEQLDVNGRPKSQPTAPDFSAPLLNLFREAADTAASTPQAAT